MDIDRRRFISWSAGGALLLGLGDPGAVAATEAAPLSPWLRIGADGKVTLFSTVSEMGQGARTGQAQVLADELDVSWDAISVEMVPDVPPFSLGFGIGTGGSSSIRAHWTAMRKAAATARAQLVIAATHRWNCDAADCQTALGQVKNLKTSASLAYGELAADAASCAAPADPPLKPAAERRYIGKPVATLENVDKSTGRAIYGIDVRLDGMLHASIRQAPVYGAKLASVDDAPAMAVAGVRKVVTLDAAVAVVADSTWAAFKGVRALQPQWSTPNQVSTSGDIEKRLAAAMGGQNASVSDAAVRDGLRADFAKAAVKVEATYQTAYLAHAALEPMNTTAQVTDGKVEIWSPTQVPTRLRRSVALALSRPPEQVVVHNTLLGGAYGRRLQVDYAVQAALIAREAGGAPVQLTWTREEDTGHDFYRKAVRTTYRAALGADGTIDGYEAVGASTDATTGGAEPKPYGLKRFASTQSSVKTGIPQGPWRSVDEGLSAFGRESFIDECAYAAKTDPLAYRRRLLGDNARALRVLDAAAKGIGWGSPKPRGTGRGLAIVEAFGSLVATGLEVRVAGKAIKVTRIVVAGDLGTAVNPQQVRAQFEGGATMGLSAALGEAMTFTAGKPDQSSFDTYQLLRMRQAPPVQVLLFDSPDAAVGGAGEPGVPGVAPALANAVFDAIGKRVRTLPFSSQGFTV
ncbi:MAG: molybdopterin cofactor-binding domain-containing protein [Caulobacterales bacterium]